MNHKPIPESLGYLLVQICRAHRNRAQELMARLELHTGQEMMLLNLWPQDGLSHSELAQNLCIQPATVTKMLDRMESRGLVERRPDPGDQRVSRVYLTGEGRELQGPIEALWDELEAQTTAKMTTEERLLLRRLLMQVYDNLL